MILRLLLFVPVFVVLSFSTSAQSTLWIDTFDSVTEPDLPNGWAASGSGWSTDDASASPGSGGNNVIHKGSTFGALETPALDLTDVTSATLQYLARRTSSYAADSLTVLASTDGGATYPITLIPMGAALPGAESTYEAITVSLPASLLGQADVRFRFDARGGTSSGSSLRIDDLSLEGEGSIPVNAFGFASATSSAPGGSTGHTIPLALTLDDASNGLQGLQFDVVFDATLLPSVTVQRGTAVSDPATWTLSTNQTGDTLHVVLIGSNTTALSEGAYDPLLLLNVETADVSASTPTTLTLSNIIGAQATPTGDDASLIVPVGTHTLTLQFGTPQFDAPADTLDLGIAATGQTVSLDFVIANTGGTADLVISEIASGDARFSVTPPSATIGADDDEVFTVSFTPEADDLGRFNTLLTFTHNASGGSTDLPVKVEVIPNRGDVNGDNAVDVVDLVLVIDYILGKATPDDAARNAADLHPFSSGNGLLDVRDLTVLSQAIARGQWPDGIVLPVSPFQAQKIDAPILSPVRTRFRLGPQGMQISLEQDVPVRAVQLLFRVSGIEDPTRFTINSQKLDGVTVQTDYQPAHDAFSLLAYRLDGEPLPAGLHPLAFLTADTLEVGDLTLLDAISVDMNIARLLIETHIESMRGSSDQPTDGFTLSKPYPHPFRSDYDDRVLLPIRVAEVLSAEASIYDIQGRRVRELANGTFEPGTTVLTWDGRDHSGQQIAPGLYFFRFDAPNGSRNQPIIVVN